MSKFYTFHQNNSGGSFVYSEDRGLTVYVIIEANDAEEAKNKAESIGIYFDDEYDCPCCGSRWTPVSERDAKPHPSIYGEHPQNRDKDFIRWEEKDVCVHYLDGRVEWYE